MELSRRQTRALADICDTFCPAGEGAPAASELDVAAAVLNAVSLNPRSSERRQLAALLSLWNTPVLGAVGGAGPRRFSALSQDEREALLRNWADSANPQRRAVFEALRKGSLLFYWMLGSPDGGPNPAWGRSATTARSGGSPTRLRRR